MVEPTHLKNIRQIGNLPQIGVKIEKYLKNLKPPPRINLKKTGADISQRQIGPTVHIHQGREKTWRPFSPFEEALSVGSADMSRSKSECHVMKRSRCFMGVQLIVQSVVVVHVKQELTPRLAHANQSQRATFIWEISHDLVFNVALKGPDFPPPTAV